MNTPTEGSTMDELKILWPRSEAAEKDPIYLTREELEAEVRDLRARLKALVALEEGTL